MTQWSKVFDIRLRISNCLRRASCKMDHRYFNLLPHIVESGINIDELCTFLTLKSFHPFCFNVQSIAELCEDWDIKIMAFRLGDAGNRQTKESPYYFSIHIGAIEMFCEYLHIKPITAGEALIHNLKTMNVKLRIKPTPKHLLSFPEPTSMREAERFRLIKSVIEMDEEIGEPSP
jgi:hypothetical protein